MSPYLLAFLGMSVASLIVVAATGVPAIRRALALQRRARALQEHPTLLALRAAQSLDEKLRGMQASMVEIRMRSSRIGEATAQLLATSALLRLQMDRIGFATRLLLETFVPTLRGSMSD